MRFRLFLIERNGLGGGRSHRRISFQRFYVNVSQIFPSFCNPRPGFCVIWVLLERALKKIQTSAQIFFAALVRKIETLEIKIVRFAVRLQLSARSDGQLDL